MLAVGGLERATDENSKVVGTVLLLGALGQTRSDTRTRNGATAETQSTVGVTGPILGSSLHCRSTPGWMRAAAQERTQGVL